MNASEEEQWPVQLHGGDRLLVVANPAIRRDIHKVIASLQSAAPEGVEIDVRISSHAGEARELALHHAPGARVIAAIGGDGTVGEVATAAVKEAIPLAILPGGSTNIIARELRIPTDIEAGAALLFGPHRIRSIDVGTCGERIFLHMAGAGFDSRLFARSSSRLKRKVGWLAYLPAAARTLLDRAAEVRVTVDGQAVRARSPLVLVANGKSVVHPMLKLATGISRNDGILDVFVVTATDPVAMTRVLGRAATRHLDRSPWVTRLCGRHVELDADPPLPVQLDGDVDGLTPVSFGIMDRALKMIVPRIPASASS